MFGLVAMRELARRATAAAILAVWSLPAGVAQLPAVPVPNFHEATQPTLQPGSAGWPGLATPSQPPPPPVVLEETRKAATDTPIVHAITQDQYLGEVRQPLPPLPGTLEEEAMYWHEARRGFRLCTWRGTEITALPYNLLWEPPLASKREPRMLVNPTSLESPSDSWTLDTSIGTTVGLFRARPIGHDLAFQLDVFGVVHTRLSPEDLDASDYRFGIPLSVRWGPWHGKLAYEHTSAHLGDEFIRRNPGVPITAFAKDEVVVGVGRWMWDRVRLYGQYSYAWNSDLPLGTTGDDARRRVDVGCEVYCPAPTGLTGQPFFAINFDSRGDQDWEANVNVQAGWMWRNPYQRLSNIRLYGEYYNGRSPFNQFYQVNEDFYGIGWSCDY